MSEIIPPVGSPVEEIKDAFGVGQVPLASNFSDLIDVADVGRKAAGLSPDQPSGQGQGMYLDENRKLAVLPQAGGGINVNATGVGVTVETSKGLVVGTNGLAVKPGIGINVSAAGVGVTVETSKGLVLGSNGLAVKPDNGIHVSAAGVGVTVETSKGLALGTNGLAVKPGSGINVSAAGVGVTVETSKGLVLGTNGLAVQASNGINLSPAGVGVAVAENMGLTVDANGLAIKPGSGINLGAAGVEVIANAAGGILIDSEGIGINCGAGLTISNNQLIVSPAVPSRVSKTYTITTSSSTWKSICSCPWYEQNNFAELLIVAEGNGFKQRFILTFSFDGELNSNNRSYALSISNVGVKPSSAWAIKEIRVASAPGAGDTYIQANMTSNSTVTCTLSYSPLSIGGKVVIRDFSDNPIAVQRGLISVLSNGSIQG